MVRKVCQRGRQKKKVLLSARASSPYHFAAFDDLRYHVNSNNRYSKDIVVPTQSTMAY